LLVVDLVVVMVVMMAQAVVVLEVCYGLALMYQQVPLTMLLLEQVVVV
jgi:hypothetical protein